jgi:Uma2 family endonuclease
MDEDEDEILTPERWRARVPPSRFELIYGKLVVGRSFARSRALLQLVLASYGPSAILGMAPGPLWWAALAEGDAAPAGLKTIADWQHWAERLPDPPELPDAGPAVDDAHASVVRQLATVVEVLRQSQLGWGFARPTQLWAASHVLAPDLLLLARGTQAQVEPWCIAGVADLVIEVCFGGESLEAFYPQLALYGALGVPEAWVVDPRAGTIAAFDLGPQTLQTRPPDADGLLRPRRIPGIALDPTILVQIPSAAAAPRPIAPMLSLPLWRLEQTAASFLPPLPRLTSVDNLGMPIVPTLALDPVPIPPALVQLAELRGELQGPDGLVTLGRQQDDWNLLGLLLMSVGLVEAVRLYPARYWVHALARLGAVPPSSADDRDRPITPDELAAMQIRADAASPPPWRRGSYRGVAEDYDLEGPIEPIMRGQVGSRADADFIAAARSDVPRLIAEVRRLQAQLRAREERAEE